MHFELESSIAINAETQLGASKGRVIIRERSGDTMLTDAFRYESHTLGDKISDEKLSWAIDRKLKAAVQQWLMRHRLRLSHADSDLREPEAVEHDYIEYPSLEFSAWMRRSCEQGESVLACLPTGEKVSKTWEFSGTQSLRPYFVWTTRRAQLVCMSATGDLDVQSLALPLSVQSMRGRDLVSAGEFSFRTDSSNEELFEEIAKTSALPRRFWRLGLLQSVFERNGERTALALASRVDFASDPRIRISLPLVDGNRKLSAVEIAEAIAETKKSGNTDTTWESEDLQQTWLIWSSAFGLETLRAAMSESETRSKSAKLSDSERGRRVRDWLEALADHWPEDQASEVDSVFALLARGFSPLQVKNWSEAEVALRRFCATLFLRRHLSETADAFLIEISRVLPRPSELELLPGEERSGSPLQDRLFEILVQRESCWPPKHPKQTEILREKAALRPFDVSILRELSRSSGIDAFEREQIDEIIRVLEHIGPWRSSSETKTPAKVHALSDEQQARDLVHPSARASKAGALQALLATVDSPDHSALKKFCDPGGDATLREVVRQACNLFDRPLIDVYISHGEHRMGVRVHDGKPPFLLVGGEHMQRDAPAYLDASELRFAVGAEVAHLCLGHSRVTSREVWAGAFDKSKASLEVVLSLVPFLGIFPWGKRIGAWAQYLENKLIAKAIDRVRGQFGEGTRAQESSMDRSVGLIAAHRMMQLTADRAGLLLSGDLEASIAGMWKMRPESSAQIPLIEEFGLVAALTRLIEQNDEIWSTLYVRCAALLVFYRSPEYQELRRAMRGDTEGPSADVQN